MKKLRFFYIMMITVFIVPFSLTGCKEKEEVIGDIYLPPAPLISESSSWAVIDSSYLRLRERPEENARVVTTLWRGYVLEIISRGPTRVFIENQEDYWYQITYDGLQGWVFGSYLSVYDTKDDAEKAARSVREQ